MARQTCRPCRCHPCHPFHVKHGHRTHGAKFQQDRPREIRRGCSFTIFFQMVTRINQINTMRHYGDSIISRQARFVLLRQAGVPGLLLYVWALTPYLLPTKRFADSYNHIDNTAVLQLALIATGTIYLVLTWHLYQRQFKSFLLRSPLRWFFAYTCLAFLSSLWSSDPLYSLASAHASLVCLLLCLMLCIRFEGRFVDLIDWILWWGISMCCIRLVIYPEREWFNLQTWHGFSVYATAPLIFLGLLDWNRFKWRFAFMLFLAIIATSAKVYIGILAGFVVCAFLSRHKVIKVVAILSVCAVLLSVLASHITYEGFARILFAGRDESVIETASGRTVVWPMFMEMVFKSPILGYGFAMAEKIAYQQFDFYFDSSHNVFLTAMLYSGIGGCVLMCLFWYDLFHSLLRHRKSHGAVILLMCLIVSFSFTLFDQGLGNKVMLTWIAQAFLCGVVVQWLSTSDRDVGRN